MIRTLTDGGINWNWYLCGDFNDKDMTVHIFYHDRWHKYEDRGSKHPVAESVSYQIVESPDANLNRVATAVRVPRYGSAEYRVTNPANIFSYRDMTHYVSE